MHETFVTRLILELNIMNLKLYLVDADISNDKIN